MTFSQFEAGAVAFGSSLAAAVALFSDVTNGLPSNWEGWTAPAILAGLVGFLATRQQKSIDQLSERVSHMTETNSTLAAEIRSLVATLSTRRHE